jgi:hypothetical protein
VPFVVARADLLPLPDRAVDAVVAVRIMAHIADPAGFLRECCRVADKMIVIDFPSRRSCNALSELLFSFKRSVEGDTRRFRIFRSSGAGVPGSGARLSTGRSVPSVLLSDGGASPARLAYRRGSAREHVSPARPDAPIRLADHRLVPSQRRAVTGQVGRGDLRNVCAREAHAHALG